MAATAESMISSLAGPSEGSEGSAPAAPSEAASTAIAPPDTAIAVTEGEQSAAPAGGEPQQQAAAPAAPKDTPEDIQRKHLAALHEARGENKTLRQQLADMQQQIAALQKPQAEPAAEPEQEPDFLADPKGYVDKKVQGALAKLDKAEKATQETAEQVKQREANEAILRATQTAEAQFYSQTPDYPEALQHIRGVRTQQLQQLFPEATAEQINNHIAFEERETARMLVSQKRNPAEYAYHFAQTLGYKKAAPPPAKTTAQPIDKDAVRTLGSGGGSGAPADEAAGNAMPEFAAARAEVAARFKRKK
jgi:hypothetical protein